MADEHHDLHHVQGRPHRRPWHDIKMLVFGAYDRAVDVAILGVVPLMLVALGFAFVDAVVNTIHMIPLLGPSSDDAEAFRTLVENVLDVIILIELFNTFMEYARTRHIRISTLLDVTIVFALREVLIKLYALRFVSGDVIALCGVVIILVIARTLTTRFPAAVPSGEHGSRR